MKRCGKCCLEKDEKEFHKSKRRKDGLSNRCKICKSIEHKEYIAKYPEKFKEKYLLKLPEWRAANKEKCAKYAKSERERKKIGLIKKKMSEEEMKYLKEMAEKNQIEWKNLSEERKKEWKKQYRQRPERKLKEKSRHRLQEAVLYEKIRRPEKCEECGIKCIPHGHHFDYSKPLFVKWLCHLCHCHEHGERLDILQGI